jgi:dipeptidyl-peptidase-4
LRARPLLIHGLVDTNVHARNTIGLIAAMMALDRPFSFLPLPNSNHHYVGYDLVAALAASAEYFKARIGSGDSER